VTLPASTPLDISTLTPTSSIEFERPAPTVCDHEKEETAPSPEGELDAALKAIGGLVARTPEAALPSRAIVEPWLFVNVACSTTNFSEIEFPELVIQFEKLWLIVPRPPLAKAKTNVPKITVIATIRSVSTTVLIPLFFL
jgi:hypothetical protein